MNRQCFYGEAIGLCAVDKRAPAGVDKELIVAARSSRGTGLAEVQIQPAIAVDVTHGSARRPDACRGKAGGFSDIFKAKCTPVQVESVGDLVASHENVGQPVAAHVTNSDAAAIVEVAEEVRVQRFGRRKRVGKGDAGAR